MADARFEDGADNPLRLMAQEPDDLPVLSALIQDAVLNLTDMTWARRQHRFALLVSRFRWEDREAAERAGRGVERVRSLLTFENVLAVRTLGLDMGERDQVLSILSLSFIPGAEGAGRIEIVLAGDGAIALEVEALEVALADVSRPYLAPSRRVPGHGD